MKIKSRNNEEHVMIFSVNTLQPTLTEKNDKD